MKSKFILSVCILATFTMCKNQQNKSQDYAATPEVEKVPATYAEISVKEGVYKKYANKYLGEDQLDEVDEAAVLV